MARRNSDGDKNAVPKAHRHPTMADFDAMIAESRRQARAAGMKRSDIAAAVAAARRNK